MTLAQIYEKLQIWDECRIINKETSALSVIALTRCEKAVTLWLIESDPSYLERVAEAEAEGEFLPAYPATNRERLMQRPGVEPRLPLNGLNAVRLGETEYRITGSTGNQVRSEDWETVLTLAEFFRAGWNPSAPMQTNTENLFLSRYDFQGEFTVLPPDGPLTLLPGDKLDEKIFPCDNTLAFGREDSPQPVSLPDGNTAWLIRAEWFDPWKHLEETFSHPRITGQFTPEELARRRRSIEESYAEFCPRGMALPVVVYESEPDVSLYFYERGWLEASPAPSSSAFMVMGLSKDRDLAGPHGMPLHGAALSETALAPEKTRELPLGMVKWLRRRPQPPLRLD